MRVIRFVRRCRILLCSFAPDPDLPAGGRDLGWFREFPAGALCEVGECVRLGPRRTVLEFLEFDAFAEVRNRHFLWVPLECPTMGDTPCPGRCAKVYSCIDAPRSIAMPFVRFVRSCRLVLCRFTPCEPPAPGAPPEAPTEAPPEAPAGTPPCLAPEAPTPLPNPVEGFDYSWVQDVHAGDVFEVGEFAESEEGKTCMEFLLFDAYADVPNAFWAWCESPRFTFDPAREGLN